MKKSFVIVIITGLILTSCGGPKQPTKSVVFNVPELFGINPLELDTKIGKPIDVFEPTKIQMNEGIHADRTYEKSGYSLNVEYEYGTATIYSFFISSMSGPVDDSGIEELKQIAGVWDKPTNIHIEEVRALGKKDSYTGIIITRDK